MTDNPVSSEEVLPPLADNPASPVQQSVDYKSLQYMSRLATLFMGEIQELHRVLHTIVCEEDEVEFAAREKGQVQELIQKKLAMLHELDNIRAMHISRIM